MVPILESAECLGISVQPMAEPKPNALIYGAILLRGDCATPAGSWKAPYGVLPSTVVETTTCSTVLRRGRKPEAK